MIPRTLFDGDLEGFRDSVRKFLETEAVPYHDQWEKDGQVSRDLWRKAGALGFLCPTMPEQYGGVGADFRYSTVVMEEISRMGLSGIGFRSEERRVGKECRSRWSAVCVMKKGE